MNWLDSEWLKHMEGVQEDAKDKPMQGNMFEDNS